MKKLFSILLVLIIFINSIIPSYAFAAAPEEPPEMPDWWREKYGDKQIENEEFKNKQIKTIKPPKKVVNPTPVGVAVGLTLEYLVSQNEDLQALHDDFWETIDKLDKDAARYLEENFGLSGWDDVFYNAKSGIAYVKDEFINAFNKYFSFEHEYTEIDYDNILRLLEPNLYFAIKNRFDGTPDSGGWKNYFISMGPTRYITHKDSEEDYRLRYSRMEMYVYTLEERPNGVHYVYIWDVRLPARTYYNLETLDISRLSGFYIGEFTQEKYKEALQEAKEYLRDRLSGSINDGRSEFLKIVQKNYENRPDLKQKNYTVKNMGYLPNPYGSKLNDPNEIEQLGDYETGIIEIDNQKYHIINVPNPNHTPHLEPTHPNYVPSHYPIIRPIIPVPNNPNVDDPAHPANPNNPYSPNNPNPQEVPEIPLIPDITPSPQPSPDPSPDPSPHPSPEPSPDPSPEPSTPQIPRAPEDEFGEVKSCGELDLDLKSIDLFTTKFPFSIPWDIFRALEAFFGKMGSEEPRFVLSFISDDVILELPEFIKEWIPLVRSLILLIFDVSVIYALYRWFGGAS